MGKQREGGMLCCVIDNKSWTNCFPKEVVFLYCPALHSSRTVRSMDGKTRYSEESRAKKPFAKGRPLNLELAPVEELLRG